MQKLGTAATTPLYAELNTIEWVRQVQSTLDPARDLDRLEKPPQLILGHLRA